MATRQTTDIDRVTLSDRDSDPPRVRTFARDPEVLVTGFHWTAWVRGCRPRLHGWSARAVDDERVIARGTVAIVERFSDDQLQLTVEPPRNNVSADPVIQ